MTDKNEKSINSHESLTSRRDRECRVSRLGLKRNCLDFSRLSYSREASQDQDKQSQSCDDHEKSIKMQRQEFSERRDQHEKRVKNSEEFV
jgi:hypothetical protein